MNRYIDKVSIIVPAYNAEAYIEKCISSLVCQTYENVEILIIDDGSTDLTGEICDTYQKKYKENILVEHSDNQGVSNARLKGLRKATGEYIAFVDADDWIERDYILSMLSSMEGADIVAAGIAEEDINKRGDIDYEYNGILPGRYVKDSERQKLYGEMLYCAAPYRFGILPYMCNKIFKRNLLLPFLEKADKRIFDGEDALIVYPYLLAAQKIVLTNSCGYHYIRHKNSASLRESEDAYFNVSCLYMALYESFRKSKFHDVLMLQLDNYMRCMVWKKDPESYLMVNTFFFPFNKVKQGSRIILYGMGKMGKVFFRQVRQTGYCEVIAWADERSQQFENMQLPVTIIVPDKMREYFFDYVVIAIQNRVIVDEVSNKLLLMGVAEEKIIKPDI